MSALLTFLLAGLAVVVAGSFLSRFGDQIGERTGMGGAWAGAILLAGATSLPELATDITAIRIGAPDLAIGDLFGSCMANMLILAIVDLLSPQRSLLRRSTLDNALAACLGIALTAVAAAFVLVRPRTAVWGIGPETLVIAAAYGLGMRAISRQAGKIQTDATESRKGGLLRPILGFVAAAAVILGAAPAFARSAEAIAVQSGLGEGFVGTWLVGVATSLPELVTTLSAMRMGAYDLAVGNLFGSNGFNMAILLPLDIVHTQGPLLSEVDPRLAITGMLAVGLNALGLAAVVYRAERKVAMLEPDSLLIVLGYVTSLALVWSLS